MDAEFDPGSFRDEFRDRLKAAIARKAHGRTMAVAEEETAPEDGKVINLSDALQRSLSRRRPPHAPVHRHPRPSRAG